MNRQVNVWIPKATMKQDATSNKFLGPLPCDAILEGFATRARIGHDTPKLSRARVAGPSALDEKSVAEHAGVEKKATRDLVELWCMLRYTPLAWQLNSRVQKHLGELGPRRDETNANQIWSLVESSMPLFSLLSLLT